MSKTIWAVVQLRGGDLHPMSRETLTGAQKMAHQSGSQVEAVALGSDLERVSEELGGLDLAGVRLLEHERLGSYTPGAFVSALAPVIDQHRPDIVLFPHTYQSVDFVARLAQACGSSLVSEVMSVELSDDVWLWRRPLFGGKLQSQVKVRGSGTILATLQAGAYSADDLTSGSAPVERWDVAELTIDREILGTEEVAGEHVDLSQAEVIVAVGRGLGDADKMPMIEDLASALGAELGASRPVIDSGWLDRDRQIGSSGQVVAPKLYLAIGISGAIQHLVGMKGSQVVVAVNRDESAPIFGIASYGIVGDLFEVVPALTAAVKEAKGL